MQHCPACGAENPDTSRYCRECKSRLPAGVRGAADVEREARLLDGMARMKQEPSALDGIRSVKLGTASLILGILGLGIPALITGAIALRRHHPGRGRALAGVVLGAVGTVALLVILFTPRSVSPLDRPLVPGQTARWTEQVEARCVAIETRAGKVSRSMGGLTENEIAPVYDIIDGIRIDLRDLDDITDEDELADMRDDIIRRLERCESALDQR